jgi:hypothetical protein
VRFFADEDVYNELKRLLTNTGHDVISPAELGLRGMGDEICLLYAASDSRVLITHNFSDFSLLHRAWMSWAGHWNVPRQPAHSGLLAVPHKNLLDPVTVAARINLLAYGGTSLVNSCFRLDQTGSWR